MNVHNKPEKAAEKAKKAQAAAAGAGPSAGRRKRDAAAAGVHAEVSRRRKAQRARSRSSPAATAASAAPSRSRWRARAPMIAILYLEEHDDAEETARLVEAEGSRAVLFAGDVGDEMFCWESVERINEEFGRIDILVNNAAEQHEVDDPVELDHRAARAHVPHQRVQLLPHDARLPAIPAGRRRASSTRPRSPPIAATRR